MTVTRRLALPTILAAVLGAAVLLGLSSAADPVPTFSVEVRARLHDSGRLEFAVRTEQGVQLPSARFLASHR